MALCAVADADFQQDAGGEVASASNDGYSETYVTSQRHRSSGVMPLQPVIWRRPVCYIREVVRLLLCTETITLIQPQRTDDGEAYLLTEIIGASWYGKRWSPRHKGRNPRIPYIVRIPESNMPAGVMPKRGDFVIRGIVEEINTRRQTLLTGNISASLRWVITGEEDCGTGW